MGFSAVSVIRGPGEIAGMVIQVTKRILTRPFQFREFVEQAWFITSVTLMPTILVSIPFGAVISLQVGNLTGQLGAQSFAGATAVLATVREAAPIAAALVIAGAAGSAICSDLGARKMREEIDALRVMGLDPIEVLIIPRLLALVIGLIALLPATTEILETEGFGWKKWGDPVDGFHEMKIDYAKEQVRMRMSRKALDRPRKVRVAVRVAGTRSDGTSKGLVDWLGAKRSFTQWVARG